MKKVSDICQHKLKQIDMKTKLFNCIEQFIPRTTEHKLFLIDILSFLMIVIGLSGMILSLLILMR